VKWALERGPALRVGEQLLAGPVMDLWDAERFELPQRLLPAPGGGEGLELPFPSACRVVKSFR
jgi:hypothetical protein